MKFKVEVDPRRCKGCGLCVAFCPRKSMELSAQLSSAGLRWSVFVGPEGCTGCQTCTMMCPEAALTIYEVAEEEVAADE
jgi:2-oxoglutarate ferredoxin oxidoreductase subunit delta